MEPPVWTRLLNYAKSGGAVWFFLGDQVSAENYNRHGLADGKGILPAKLSTLVGQGRQSEEFFRLRIPQPAHPVLAYQRTVLNWEHGLEITKLCQAAYMSAEEKKTVDLTDAAVQKKLDSYTSLIAQGKGKEVLC